MIYMIAWYRRGEVRYVYAYNCRKTGALIIYQYTIWFRFQSLNLNRRCSQQDIPSTTQIYILRSSINNSMIKCSI